MKQIFIKLSALLLFCLIANTTVIAQYQKNGRTGTGKIATVPMSKTSEPKSNPQPDYKTLPIEKKMVGIYEAKWKNADGTTFTQNYKLNNILTKPMGGTNKSNSKPKTQVKNSQDEPPSGDGWICHTEEKRVSLDDNSFMTVNYSEQAANIYPGAIYKFDNFINGSWKSEGKNRNSIRLSARVFNVKGNNYEDVENPDADLITNGIAQLFQRFSTDPNRVTSSSMAFTAYEIESLSDAAVKIGASGYGYGFFASNLFSMSNKEQHKYILIDCTKEMFTINTSVPKEGFFNAPGIQTSDMMFISSVTYGVRILACMDIEVKDKAIADKFSAGGSWGVAGGQIDVDAFSREFSSSSTIKMYVVGGKSNEVYPVYSISDLKKRCADIASSTNYNTVAPIKYQLRNLNDEVVLSSSATDYFKTRSCYYQAPDAAPKDIMVKVTVPSMRTQPSNTDAELYGEIWAQAFDANGKEIFAQGNKDRLFDIFNADAHLKAEQLHSYYHPGNEVNFKIKADKIKGITIKVFYWLMEYDNIGSNDYLHLQGGKQQKASREKDMNYCIEFKLDDVPNDYKGLEKESNFTAQGEGVFTILTNVKKSFIENN